MILILGGTTEGRAAVRVIEQAGKTYYYSTKSDRQEIVCPNGVRLTGGMDSEEMVSFCREKEIKLVIDAAHPFASILHQNVSIVSKQLEIPVIRLERTYPEHNDKFIWCDDFDDAIQKLNAHSIKKLLALSGVNTITPLKPFWKDNLCWFRILNRKESLQIAEENGFPEDRLIFLDEETTDSKKLQNQQLHKDEQKNHLKRTALIEQLKPDAILTKESGYSDRAKLNSKNANPFGNTGSFEEKASVASEYNIPVFVLKRPKLPEHFITVYGEVGLRIKTERLLHEFFALRTGYTTGMYATAAAKAALTALITQKEQTKCIITLPNSDSSSTFAENSNENGISIIQNTYNEPIVIPVESTEISENKAFCTVIKDAGDDPDVTNKTPIQAEALWATEKDKRYRHKESDETIEQDEYTHNNTPKDVLLSSSKRTNTKIILRGGKGIGTVTLPGLGLNIGEPAINATPRRMIKKETEEALNKYSIQNKTLIITISVPEGEEIAKRTFNAKLGIKGGISIIGTSGIVRPFSNEAFIATIRKEIEIARAIGCQKIVINSGAKSERFLKKQYPTLTPQAFIHYGNFIGETLTFASENNIQEIIMGIMIGKAVKLAEGALDTHSKKTAMNKLFIKDLALSAGCNKSDTQKIDNINLARGLWSIFPKNEQERFLKALLNKCYEHCTKIYANGKQTILLINEEGNIFV